MKKKNNKGFSLIELIIAIAILVILTGLLAPQFMRYMERSREAKDMQSLDTIYGAVQTALADENAFNDFSNVTDTDLNALKANGMSLDALITAGTGATPASAFCAEVLASMGTTDAEDLWTSRAATEFAGTDDVNEHVFVAITADLRVTVWIGIQPADTVAGVIPENNALNPTTAISNITTAGATFYISK